MEPILISFEEKSDGRGEGPCESLFFANLDARNVDPDMDHLMPEDEPGPIVGEGGIDVDEAMVEKRLTGDIGFETKVADQREVSGDGVLEGAYIDDSGDHRRFRLRAVTISEGIMPPQTPEFCLVAIAKSAHWVRTRQSRHKARAVEKADRVLPDGKCTGMKTTESESQQFPCSRHDRSVRGRGVTQSVITPRGLVTGGG